MFALKNHKNNVYNNILNLSVNNTRARTRSVPEISKFSSYEQY